MRTRSPSCRQKQRRRKGCATAKSPLDLMPFCARLLALEGVHQLHGTAREPAAAELRRDICDQLLRMAMLLNNSRELEEPAASPLEARGPGSCSGSPVRRVPSPAPFRLQCAALLLWSRQLPAAPLRTVCLPLDTVCLPQGSCVCCGCHASHALVCGTCVCVWCVCVA